MKREDLISDEMRDMNVELHNDPTYGANARKAGKHVVRFVDEHKCNSVLDYGCGKARLAKAVLKSRRDVKWQNYDPARAEFNADPRPADLVVVRDVMEHVEHDKIDNVLKHVASLSNRIAWFVIPEGKSTKTLPDGRNAHLTQLPPAWWAEKLDKYFVLVENKDIHNELRRVYKPKPKIPPVCQMTNIAIFGGP